MHCVCYAAVQQLQGTHRIQARSFACLTTLQHKAKLTLKDVPSLELEINMTSSKSWYCYNHTKLAFGAGQLTAVAPFETAMQAFNYNQANRQMCSVACHASVSQASQMWLYLQKQG